MEISSIFSHLQAHQTTFDSLLRGTPAPLQLWRPQPKHWCLLEIICHLYDEEREDFRARLRSVLEDPSQDLPAIDPQAWIENRQYLHQDFAAKLEAFLEEREASVLWLESLTDPAWENAYQHPKMGALTARMFLANWLAHDYLHIRQITRLKYQHLQATSGVRMDYAG